MITIKDLKEFADNPLINKAALAAALGMERTAFYHRLKNESPELSEEERVKVFLMVRDLRKITEPIFQDGFKDESDDLGLSMQDVRD